MPFLMSVLPSRMIVTPSPCSTNSTSGKDALPWETRYAGPESGFLNTGVEIFAWPMLESAGQPETGLASNRKSRHAFWIVDRREGSWMGSATNTLAMLACPSPFEVVITLKPTPLGLLPCPLTSASKPGLKGSEAQLATWNGEANEATPPWSPVSVAWIAVGVQLVGLNWKLGRSTVTFVCLS